MTTVDINTAAAMAMADTAPVLATPPILTTRLPGGYIDDVGHLHRDVTVREMNGLDEEAVDNAMRTATNPFLSTDTILARCVEQIGTITDVGPATVRGLLRGDRDTLVLFIRRATYGDILDGTVICPHCEESNDVKIDLAKDIEIKELENGNKQTFTVSLRNGRSAEVRLVNGEDMIQLGDLKSPTISQANTFILSRCVISIDGQMLLESLSGPEHLVQQLGAGDREKIINFMDAHQPGPQFQEVSVSCASCGGVIPTPVDVASLLR